MSTTTARLALVKADGSDIVDIDEHVNDAFDRLDARAGFILVEDGVTPPDADLYDGAVVKEKDSGISWVAQENGGGTFDRHNFTYPYLYKAKTTATTITSGTTYQTKGADTYQSGENSSDAQRQAVTNFWTCPVKGIYHMRAFMNFELDAAGYRAMRFNFNGTGRPDLGEIAVEGNGVINDRLEMNIIASFDVGDDLGTDAWQNSGSTLDLDIQYEVVMISPITA